MKHIALPCLAQDLSLIFIPVQLDVWQGDEQVPHICTMEEIDGMILIKTEVMPDGHTKQILKDPELGTISEKIL